MTRLRCCYVAAAVLIISTASCSSPTSTSPTSATSSGTAGLITAPSEPPQNTSQPSTEQTSHTTDAPTTPKTAAAGVNNQDPAPMPAVPAILSALRSYPVVAIADRHGLQQEHDVIVALLHDPAFAALVNDILVEFGNSRLQSVADDYLLNLKDLTPDAVAQMWRQTGGTLWDAPVYERFFRTVRSVNETLPAGQRIRILLGDSPIDFAHVHSVADADYVRGMENASDQTMADVLERESLARGRRSLVIAGGGHLRRGLHADIHPRSDAPNQPPNLGTLIEQRHPGKLYVIDTLIDGYLGTQQPRAEAMTQQWTPPTLATLTNTWLGNIDGPDISYRAMTPQDKRYGSQADAVLYLGPDPTLTLSLPDKQIYTSGDYPAFLNSLTPIMSAVYGDTEDWLGQAIQYATSNPRLFP